MLTVASPDAAELRCNATFEALMWSMARPGGSRSMPEAGLAGLIETLVDIECVVFADDTALLACAAQTGALLAQTPGEADHVFLTSLEGVEAVLPSLQRGTALYPDHGATLAANVAHGRGHRVRLTGPGIEGECDVTLGISPGFWDLRARLCAYPEGFDLLLVDGQAVIGIPRSTKVEVL